MRLIIAAVFATCSAPVAHALTLDRCCMDAATSKAHIGQAAACYASVCQQYVTMKPDGHHCGASGKTFTAYRAALQATCGIDR